MNAISTLAFDNLVKTHNQEITTTSKIIADNFAKMHKHVLAKIDEIIAETPVEFNKPNFRPIEMDIKVGFGVRKERAFEITKDGFMLLVMGFTGKKAMELKIRFIQAFNWAFEQLQKSTSHQRAVLVTACDKLAVGNALRSDIYKAVGNHFGYDDVASIPAPLLPEAVAYVYELLLSKKAPAIDDGILQSAQHLAWHTQFIYSWYKAIEQPFRMLSPQLSGQIHDHIIHAKLEATHIGKQIGYDGMNPAAVEKKVWAVGFN